LLKYNLLKKLFLLIVFFIIPHLTFNQAVITLVMPVGARQLGMGETAIALADDVYATFWNPAGLAFGPLADEWELALSGHEKEKLKYDFTTLGAKEKKGFLSKSTLWSGTKNGIVRFNGKVWKEYFEYVMEQEDKISKVVREYTGTEMNLDSLVTFVKEYNQIESQEDEDDLISLKLPYNLLFRNTKITALLVDKSQRVWVGTPIGLFRFDGAKWKNYQESDAFKGPKSHLTKYITALAIKGSEIWIGTKNGLYRYRKTKFVRRGKNLLPSQHITALATHKSSKKIYVAMKNKGIARYTPAKGKGLSAKWKLFNVENGLLDSMVNNMVLDKQGHLWVGHNKGISHYSLVDWQRITFNKQRVHSLDLGDDGSIWIGTDKGVWKHSPYYTSAKGRKKNKKEGNTKKGKKGTWFHYHTGNSLKDNNDLVIETQGDDVWFVTNAGVERYNSAKAQIGLFYEQLLPALNIDDLFHTFAAGTFPLQEWGTVGGFVNFISFGEIPLTNEDGEEGTPFNSMELVGGISYGTKLNKNTGLGLNIKFIYSALAPGQSAPGEEQDGIASSYAIDIGLLWRKVILKGFSIGLVMQNIGPAVFYVDQDQSDPIPFTWKLGLAYEVFSTPNHRLVLAQDFNREAYYYESDRQGATPVYIGAWKELIYPFGDEDKDHTNSEVWDKNLKETVFNSGIEYTFANVISFRAGVLYDEAGQRNELDFGIGLLLSDILEADATFIKTLSEGIRNGQTRFGFIFKF